MSQDDKEKDAYEVAFLLGEKAQEYVNATFSPEGEEFVEVVPEVISEYEAKVRQLVDAGYTRQEAEDKVDFDEAYANVLASEPEVEEEVVEEDVFVEEYIEPEPLINPYRATTDLVTARDGTIWDGTVTITIGTVTYNADAREVHVVEAAPVLTPNSEIVDILRVGETFNALGWTRGLEYKGESRYWVDTFNNRIPVRSTSEKPV